MLLDDNSNNSFTVTEGKHFYGHIILYQDVLHCAVHATYACPCTCVYVCIHVEYACVLLHKSTER